MNSLEKEDCLIQVRDKLRRDGIKLWLSPYYLQESGSSMADIQRLAEDFSNSLNISIDVCFETLIELQTNSLEKLKQNSLYQESGVATLKIKVLQAAEGPKVLTKEVDLSLNTNDLRNIIIKDQVKTGCDRLKLICSGKILEDTKTLFEQGVKNGQQILAIALSESPNEIVQHENKIKELEDFKSDSRLLAVDNEYMQLEDQFGNPIKIPAHEKKALIVAMALHEKGKSALKRGNYSSALVYFLEADVEFRQCNSQLLNSVDNYALLDLDIAWCYLCLESFVHLPEAHERLKRCEEKFHSTYGNNFERLIAIKGTQGNEAALFMRLHLLQAIVLYHQNRRDEALVLFKQSEQELQNLKVDENSVLTLLELGYSEAEARLGLRTMKGDVNRAANYINENREKRAESRKKAIAKEILEKERKKLGKCADGKQYVDPNFLNILVNMGYNKEVARIALSKTNNVISDSIQYIQENPIPGPSDSKSQELLKLVEDLVPQLVEAGFDGRMARLALEKHTGDIMHAAEELISNDGIVSGDLSMLKMACQSVEKIKKQHEEKKEAFKRLAEDIDVEDDDHLDLTLDREELFLKQYLSLLNK